MGTQMLVILPFVHPRFLKICTLFKKQANAWYMSRGSKDAHTKAFFPLSVKAFIFYTTQFNT